jgi:hypothetical protein
MTVEYLLSFQRGLNAAFIYILSVLFLLGVIVTDYIVDCEMTVEFSNGNWLRFFRAFSSVVRQMPRWCPQRRGTARTLPNFFVALCIFFCIVLCDVCFVTFPVLFVCICVLYYCHRVATQLQLNISYLETKCEEVFAAWCRCCKGVSGKTDKKSWRISVNVTGRPARIRNKTIPNELPKALPIHQVPVNTKARGTFVYHCGPEWWR